MTKIRLMLLGLFFFAAFAAILLRTLMLQVLPASPVAKLAKQQSLKKVEIVGRRGAVLDRNGRELSVSINSLSLYANPQLVQNAGEVARVLAPVLGKDRASILAKLKQSERKFVWIERQLDRPRMQRLAKIDIAKLKGIGVLPEYRREFPQGNLASHVLGFVDVDGKGIEGLERRFNNELAGSRQSQVLAHDNLGRPTFTASDQIRLDINDGAPLQLTLDARLQFATEEALRKMLRETGSRAATAVVMDPRDGAVLALANLPDYDPNYPGDFAMDARRNRALTDPFEPGSVMKPFVAAAALETKKITPDSVIDAGNGRLQIGKHVIGEADANHHFDKLSIHDLVKYSSNIATVNLSRLIGYDRTYQAYKRFGFGEATGIELAGEARGSLVKMAPKQLVEQATQSYGHGMSVTVMQLAAAFGVIANGGRRVKPHLLQDTPEEERKIGERVLAPEVAKQLSKILESVTQEGGTGTRAALPGIRVAGKTGTARKVNVQNGAYEVGAYYSSFVGYLPAEAPRFVIAVMADQPSSAQYTGGMVAAPAFAQIAQAALRLSAPIDSPIDRPNVAQKSEAPRNILKGAHSGEATGQMPALENLPLTQAMRLLGGTVAASNRLELLGEGRYVAAQLPAAGEALNASTRVHLRLR